MSRARTHYWKTQTKYVRLPAAVQAFRCGEAVAIRIHPERACDQPFDIRNAASILLTPHEAMAFAAWLSEQAEAILAKQARDAARKAARAAAKEAKP